jgi:hypothetical protein
MGILYDITEDYLYQQGIGKAKQDRVVELLKEGTWPIEKIASLTKLSVDHVKQIARECKP